MKVTAGTCGDNVTWKLEGDTLTISGTGPMFDYKSYNGPWNSTRMDIKSIVVGEGITTIGNSAFEGCSKVTSVSLPKTLTRIGGYAFDHCSSLKELSIPDGVTYIGGYAFSCCTFESIKLPSGLAAGKSVSTMSTASSIPRNRFFIDFASFTFVC